MKKTNARTQTDGCFYPIKLGQRVILVNGYRGCDCGTVVEILGPKHIAVNLDGYAHNPVDFHTSEIAA